MFKKLKEKITEEVKSSPQRFQQLTQSVSDKFQGTSTSEENFFSIGEDDANTSAASNDQGFSSVTLVSPTTENKIRRSSTSSIASDVSFLPRYEGGSLYHLQSDLDISASEVEDNVSQASSQLGHVSKEQVYSAFQKAQMRYHKYRGRYTDLARHYKELERENAKMKSVLVETQDKAIRRVTELKEQCALEQKAKAHLESALRDELDERQMKIQSLQTKIELLKQGQSSPNNSNSLIDLDKKETNDIESDKLEQLTKYLNDARSEIESLNGKIQEYKANAIVFQTKEQDYKMKISGLEKDIAGFSEREKENNIKLAENKMELHNELLSKDSEINRLKKENESLRTASILQEKDQKSTKLENLQNQNSKLIEKVENLTQKCNNLENELLKIEKYKIEIKELSDKNVELSKINEEGKRIKEKVNELMDENNQLQCVIGGLKVGLNNCRDNLKRLTDEKTNLISIIENEKQNYETQIATLQESAKKGLFTLEKQISERIRQSYEEKENVLKQEFSQKIENIALNDKSLKDVHLQLIEKENIIKTISEECQQVKENYEEEKSKYKNLENNHLELIEECNQLRTSVGDLQKQVAEYGNEGTKMYEEKIGRLQANIKTLQEELSQLQRINKNIEKDNVQLAQYTIKLENSNRDLLEKVRLIEESREAVEMENTECDLLEIKVRTLEQEQQSLLEDFEDERKIYNNMLKEPKELKIKEINIKELEKINKHLEEKVIKLKGYLKEKEGTIVEINKVKLELEQELIKLKESFKVVEEREQATEMVKTECNLLQIKFQQLENEKNNLIKSFEGEREIFNHSFKIKNKDFDAHKEEIMAENVSLAKENLELKKVNVQLLQKVRIFEEKEEAVEMETTECNIQKLKVHELEKEKEEILKGVEMEREMFNKILAERKELKVKEEHIKGLEASNKHLTEKIAKYKEYLKKKDQDIIELHKVKLELEQEINKLKESIRIGEEGRDAFEVEKTECDLLQLRIKALENEKQDILSSFEAEREHFEEEFTKIANMKRDLDKVKEENIELAEKNNNLLVSLENEKKAMKGLSEQNVSLKSEKEKLNEKLKKEIEIYQDELRLINEEVEKLTQENDKLKKDLKKNDEKIQDLTNVLNKEKNEHEKTVQKLQEMQQELDKNNCELGDIRRSLESVEKMYNEIKNKQSDNRKALEEKDKKLKEVQDEKLNLEKDYKKKTDEYNFKVKEMNVIEQQYNVLKNDKNLLVNENKEMREKIEQLTEECKRLERQIPKSKELEQVKKQNELLQNECDKLNQEISELKVRINQLSSDNRHITEEHEDLIIKVEEYKAKHEFLEQEKGHFEDTRFKLETERNTLQETINELNQQLLDKKNDLETSEKTSSILNNLDLAKIQQDFFEIKEKCDNLFVENKNIKAEYTKLQEKCDNFRNVKKDLENQISELERHYNEVLHEKQLLQDEVQELKISPVNVNNTSSNSSTSSKLDNLSIVPQEISLLGAAPNGPNLNCDALQKELEHLREKLTQYKSLDVTNKSSIEFYENELQKMKIKHEKLNRKLDETLVTLHHCSELSNSTEIEYLKNVLYNYMLGKESLVLARVIAAVCKFDPSQTEAILQKEQQKQTLLGQLGLL